MTDVSGPAAAIANVFTRMQAMGDVQMAQAWANIFRCDQKSSQYYSGLAGIAERLEGLRAGVEGSAARDVTKQQFAEAIEGLQGACAAENLVNWSTSRLRTAPYSEFVNRLKTLDDLVQPIYAASCDPKDVDEFIAALNGLIADVDALKIDARVRAALKLILGRIVLALGAIDAFGPEGVMRMFASATVDIKLLLHAETVRDSAGEARLRDWASRLSGAFVKFQAAIKVIVAGGVFIGRAINFAHTYVHDLPEVLNALPVVNDSGEASPESSEGADTKNGQEITEV